MSTTYKNIKIPWPTEGVIRTAQLNDTVAPENSVQLAINMNFDRIGAIQTRPGLTTLGTVGGSPGAVAGFGTLSVPTTTNYRMFLQVGTNLATSTDGNSWTNVRTLSTNAYKARFAQYLNYIWMVNGNAGDAVQTSDGSAFSTTLVPASFPKGDYISAGFEGRVWVADKSTDAIYYTDIVQFTPPSTYTLTYDPAVNFIKNFSPQDGQTITGLWRVPRALLVFKQDTIYRIYGASSIDNYPAYNVGTYSQESIVQTKDGVYFHHSSGFYKFDYNGQPIEISRRIIDIVKAIPRGNYEKIIGFWDGYDAIEWYIGSVTIEGVTYASCSVRYTISTQVWTVYDYGSQVFLAFATFQNTTSTKRLVTNSNSTVLKIGEGNSDQGNPIYFEMIDRWRSFTDMYAKSKSISGLNVYTENAAGTRLEYQTEKSPIDVWEELGTIDSEYDALFPNASTKDFTGIRLRLVGSYTGPAVGGTWTPIIYHGMEILSLQDKGFETN